MSVNTNIIAMRLRALREERGLTLQQVANAIGASNGVISKWENGISEPQATPMRKLEEFYDRPTDYLCGRTDDFDAPLPAAPVMVSVSKEEVQLLELYRSLPADTQQLLRETARAWKNSATNHNKNPSLSK